MSGGGKFDQTFFTGIDPTDIGFERQCLGNLNVAVQQQENRIADGAFLDNRFAGLVFNDIDNTAEMLDVFIREAVEDFIFSQIFGMNALGFGLGAHRRITAFSFSWMT